MLCVLCSLASQQTTPTKKHGKSKTIYQLHSIQPRSSNNLQSKRHGTSSTQRCIVSIWNQSTQQIQSPFFLLCKWNLPRKQRSHTKSITNNQSSHDISSRIWTWITLHQLRWSRPTKTSSRENGPSATTNYNKIDNTTSLGVVKHTIQPKKNKAMDVRFH